MKKTLNKVFKKGNIEIIVVTLVILLLIEYLIFPGLTASNTLINIASAIGAVVIGLFLYYYLLPNEEPSKEVELGETELDYINPEELKPKKKPNKKKVTKPEFPMPPHQPKKSTSKNKK